MDSIMQQNQSQVRQFTDDEFRTMFLQAANEGPDSANHFFSIFLYAHEILQGNYLQGLNQGISLLMSCRSIDEEAYERIHKGVPFYWLGTAAFLVHDYETATFFYDAAVSEDLRRGADPINNSTPALRFIQVEDDPQHIAKPLIQAVQGRIREVISNYNARSGRPANVAEITLSDIRNHFLRLAVSPGHKGWRSLATTFISFVIEWDYRDKILDLRPREGTAEPFFIHLFKGCVLFESLLKANPSVKLPESATNLGSVLQHLHTHLGTPHDIRIGASDFQSILDNLAGAGDSIQTAVEFTGKIRNTVGHDLGWVIQISKHQYHQLFRMVTSSCLHAIACLYR
jgi:hypothetical protein